MANPNFEQTLGQGSEILLGSVVTPESPEKGSQRFNWKNALLGIAWIYGSIAIAAAIPEIYVAAPAMLVSVIGMLSMDRLLPLRS